MLLQLVAEFHVVDGDQTKALRCVSKVICVRPRRIKEDTVVSSNQSLKLVDKPSIVVTDLRVVRSVSYGATDIVTMTEPHEEADLHLDAARPPSERRPQLLVDVLDIVGSADTRVEVQTVLVDLDVTVFVDFVKIEVHVGRIACKSMLDLI